MHSRYYIDGASLNVFSLRIKRTPVRIPVALKYWIFALLYVSVLASNFTRAVQVKLRLFAVCPKNNDIFQIFWNLPQKQFKMDKMYQFDPCRTIFSLCFVHFFKGSEGAPLHSHLTTWKNEYGACTFNKNL